MEIIKFEEMVKKLKKLEKENTESKAELKSITKRLSDEFDCTTIEEANKELDVLDEKITSNNKRMDKLISEIEQSVDWDNVKGE